jgi:hypothetical protein
VARRGRIGNADVAVDISQPAGARAATGTVRVTDGAAGVAVEMTAMGWLQTAGDWASVSGRGRLRRNDPEQSIYVIVDGTSIVISASDGYTLTGALQH